MKLVDDVNQNLLTSPTNIEEQLRNLLKLRVFKPEVLWALESAIVIVNAYAEGKDEDYE